MRVLIVDDHTLFCQSLKFLLEDLQPGMACETASTLAGALSRTGPFDLILLDHNFPKEARSSNGLERMRQAHKDATIIMVSGEDDPQRVHQFIAQGAAGFVPKAVDVETLLYALRTIVRGGIYVPTFALHHVPQEIPSNPYNTMDFSGVETDFLDSTITAEEAAFEAENGTDPALCALTKRQIDCLLMAAQGKSNRTIATALSLKESTVKTHVKAAFRILGVSTRAEAVFKAAALGLLPSGTQPEGDKP
jgi:DNA-binding NarL/FixJ family response regulator